MVSLTVIADADDRYIISAFDYPSGTFLEWRHSQEHCLEHAEAEAVRLCPTAIKVNDILLVQEAGKLENNDEDVQQSA